MARLNITSIQQMYSVINTTENTIIDQSLQTKNINMNKFTDYHIYNHNIENKVKQKYKFNNIILFQIKNITHQIIIQILKVFSIILGCFSEAAFWCVRM